MANRKAPTNQQDGPHKGRHRCLSPSPTEARRFTATIERGTPRAACSEEHVLLLEEAALLGQLLANGRREKAAAGEPRPRKTCQATRARPGCDPRSAGKTLA